MFPKSGLQAGFSLFRVASRLTPPPQAIKNYREASQLCMVGGPSMLSAIITMESNPVREPKKIFAVSHPTWLENSHPDWGNTPWGQSMRYLTPPMRKIADAIFPDYPEDMLMTYNMVKSIMKHQRDLVKKMGVTLVEDKVNFIVLSKKGLILKTDQDETLLTPHSDVHIINAARHTEDNALVNLPVVARPFGDTYSMSKEESLSNEPLVIIGSGLNLTWAARDFPGREIIHLIPKNDRERKDLNPALKASLRMDKAEFSKHGDTLEIKGHDLKSDKPIRLLVNQSSVFSAMGLTLNRGLIKAPPFCVTEIDASPRKEHVARYHTLTGHTSIKAHDMRGGTVPNGNLSHCYHTILGTIGQLADYPINSPLSAIAMESWEKILVKKAADAGIKVDPEFFNTLHSLLKHSVSMQIPREDQLMQIISKTFNKGLINLDDKPPTPFAVTKDGEILTWDKLIAIVEPTSSMETKQDQENDSNDTFQPRK